MCSLLGVYQHFGESLVTICYTTQCHITEGHSLKGWECVLSACILIIICSFMYIIA